MLYKNYALILLLLGITGSSTAYSEPIQDRNQESNSPQTPVESFDDFDTFEETLNNAVQLGLLKRNLEIHELSRAEMILRKIAASLFMKYLTLKNYLAFGSQSFKAWYHKLWLIVVKPSTR